MTPTSAPKKGDGRVLLQFPSISVGVAPRFKGNRSRSKAVGAPKDSLYGLFEVPIGREDDQTLGPAGCRHPTRPVANSTVLSSAPCQFARIGCSLPRTMSVAPSLSLSKQNTSEGSTGCIRAGEWVVAST